MEKIASDDRDVHGVDRGGQQGEQADHLPLGGSQSVSRMNWPVV
jgi:hypothetical protein